MEHGHLQPDLSPLAEDGVGGEAACKQETDIRAPIAALGYESQTAGIQGAEL